MPKEVGYPLAVYCHRATPIGQALGLLQASGADCCIVVEGGRRVGILTEDDLAARAVGAGLGSHDPVEVVLAVLTGEAVFSGGRNP